jgi:iron-sulfur cluster protein
MTSAREELLVKLHRALADQATSEKLWGAMTRARNGRAEAVQELDFDVEEMKETNRHIKTKALEDQSLVQKFADAVTANGGRVFFAKTGSDAIEYVAELAKRTATKLIIKSKSLTTEEIEFNHELEKMGIKAVETDLGELIIQLVNEKPVHLVMPAAHKSAVDVAEIFSKETGEKVPAEPELILKVVRRYLRPIFLSAEMGVTGANIGVAETGSILLETNEGNGRLVSSLPKIHVVIIGMEKIVPSWDDVAKLVTGHAISATGQSMTVYVSCISQHIRMAGSSEGREFHVVILDNGRSKMREDPWYSDALNCIRCGACMNICPTYGVVSGHTFGHIYPGPIGIPWTANVHGLEKATFAHLCIACGLCREICPVDIDIPMMIAKVKNDEVRQNGQFAVNTFFTKSETLAKVASATAPLSNWVIRRSISRYLMEKLVGVDRRRTLPSFSRRRLRSRLRGGVQGSGDAGKLVFFPDIYADYNDPELGVRAIKLLRSLGYHVEIPELKWSGMPYISYGEIEKAAEVAKFNLDILKRYVDQGYDVVSTEPTAIYMLREMYPKLVPGDSTISVGKKSHPFFELIEKDLGRLRLKPAFATIDAVGFHIPCHDRALSNGAPAENFLRTAGYDVRVVETGTCCGMAGTFGMKHGDLGYELSVAVGDRLFRLFKESACKIIATESSVCAMQITDGVGIRVIHPLFLVNPA